MIARSFVGYEANGIPAIVSQPPLPTTLKDAAASASPESGGAAFWQRHRAGDAVPQRPRMVRLLDETYRLSAAHAALPILPARSG